MEFILIIIIVFLPIFICLSLGNFIIKKINQKTNNMSNFNLNKIDTTIKSNVGVILKCASCNNVVSVSQKFCNNCGLALEGNNIKVEENPNSQTVNVIKKTVKPSDFNTIYMLNENLMVEKVINDNLLKIGIKSEDNLLPSDVLKRKKIFNFIFSILVFIYVSLIFFHFPFLTYLIGLIILIIIYKKTQKFDLKKYIKKQLIARPSEKITNILMSIKQTLVVDNSRKVFIVSFIISLILPLIIFIKPIILYEKMDTGYGVRYYIFGLTNFKTATIPETYKGKLVISLRGNTFSNMPFLKEVNLPNTITEIRGQAFKNNLSLKNVRLPSNLNYLGGGAFYNCIKLQSIEIPDTVTYLGGESFYNCYSLASVKLSKNITEIRGNTFENCSNLISISIPDKVTRIGGHAFYGNSSLSEVYISQDSSLSEIGSSAFRQCYSLDRITLPKDVYVNSRAFKESPTYIYYYDN